MGERKVINKYFPPDFDPTKIPRQDKAKRDKIIEKFVVRMMLPMSVRCQTCGEYMYKGKKFNSRKESVAGEEGQYLGIQIFRFYFKCITCSAEFTIKTDPENMDYVVEGGAKANFELYKEEKKEKDELSAEKEEGEKYDAMKKLENKTKESKRAMDILDALDEIRTNNARNASVGIDDILQARDSQLAAREHAAHTEAEKELELEARQAFAASRAKRVRDDDEGSGDDDDAVAAAGFGFGRGGGVGSYGGITASTHSTHASSSSGWAGGGSSSGASSSSAAPASQSLTGSGASMLAGKPAAKKPKLPIGVIIQPKAAPKPAPPPAAPAPAAPATSGGGLLGLGAYDSSGSGSGNEAEE